MQPIELSALQPNLDQLRGKTLYLHLETTAGAYTAGGFGAFIRNVRVLVRGAVARGKGPFRAGLETDIGWIYAEGLTDWEADPEGRLLMAGYEGEGRVTVVCELSAAPFPVQPEQRRITPPVPGALLVAGRGLLPPTPERAVVSVLAHPDDETFGSGGTMAAYALAGVPVTCVCSTRGEQGRNMGKPFFATRETLAELRVRELTDACAALGVGDLRLLGVWDKTTEFRDPEAVADRVHAILQEVRPTLVITSHPVNGGHPDHCAIGDATIRAVRRLPATERPRVICRASQQAAEAAGRTLLTVEVTGLVAEAKMAATRAHRSQSEAMLKRLEANPQEAEERRRRMSQERWMEYPV